MKILITGACGFVGSTLAAAFAAEGGHELHGLDNFIRPGSEGNRHALARLGVRLRHGDIRQASDFETLPAVDWLIDAAANPSVLAGADGKTSSRQLLEHNLVGTVNMLEYCRQSRAGFILLSTSRVYSIAALCALPLAVRGRAFAPDPAGRPVPGVSPAGVDESFPTAPPLSLYGTTKLASEWLALEYGELFGFPVWIDRCGVLAGAGQFGHAEQGIYSFWIHSWAAGRPLRYLGFEGRGAQVRDALHPRDLVPLLRRQMGGDERPAHRVFNVAGGARNALSLADLSAWCASRFGPREVAADPTPRRFDVPWLVLDASRAARAWAWEPQTGVEAILEEIAAFAEKNPQWLECAEGRGAGR